MNKLLVRTTIHNHHDDPFVRNVYLLPEKRGPRPKWNENLKGYEVPKTWLNELVDDLLDKEGKVYLIQPYREKKVCTTACRNAAGYKCECSCLGEFHGAGSFDKSWKQVTGAFAVQWVDVKYASRLLHA